MYKRTIDNRWSFKDADTKEFTHCYHAYPAMMIPQVARALIEEYKPEDGVELLFDPYMGSGTSLVEASIKGINAIGTDLNPLARLMSHVKTTHYDLSCIRDTFSMMQALFFEYSEDKVKNKNFDNISNYTYWYSRDSLLRLSYIYQVINECVALDFADFFKVPLSETVREVSFTRNGEFKRFRMKEEKIKDFKPDVFRLFEEKVIRNINGLEEFNSIKYPCNIGIYDFNSTIEIPSDIIQPNSVDMVVTSPPYGDSRTTVAYGQFSRWANEWFNFENAKTLDNLLMGGRVQKEELFETKSIKSELDEIKSIDPKRNLEVLDLTQGSTDDKFDTGTKREIRTSAFAVVTDDSPLYRRFNNAVLNESETADSLFFVEKIRKEYLMDEWNKNLTDKTVDYVGIWNKEKADGKLAFIVDTAWVNRGAGTIKPQYLVSVARDDQEGTPGIPCTYEHNHFDNAGNPVNAANCSHATKAHPGFNYGKYMVSFADSALIKGKEYKTPYMDIDGGYTRVGFVKAIHYGDSLYVLTNGFEKMTPAELDVETIIANYKKAGLENFIVNLQGDNHKNVTWSFRYVNPDKAGVVTEEGEANEFLFESYDNNNNYYY